MLKSNTNYSNQTPLLPSYIFGKRNHLHKENNQYTNIFNVENKACLLLSYFKPKQIEVIDLIRARGDVACALR
ncbi:hypothetical protein PPL_02301 [Heterostelium album PN500]|uniref:Uncharacterized protein n=1 Tax=Heterostelium pallidum (strain ATCC 26659 / Pp 5 / PN500) TaxID=670386 RepID=D3B1X6_HETP5|nr:hypothetical protein PPL_02301 [Heterostelium album PN500]EFA85300.1 hypothetical protein PPL_02301 [Heterostelium album PN500]|eukprot:XP_020437409.1 hypothetical protein PPL_02301 [Heterostelium album PN500]